MPKLLKNSLFLSALLFAGNATSAIFNLPADFGSSDFADCSGSGSNYTCNSDINLDDDTVNITQDLNLTLNANFGNGGSDVIINDGGNVFNFTVTGNWNLEDDNDIDGNLTINGNFFSDDNNTYTGNITTDGDFEIDDDTTITGDIQADGQIIMDNNNTITGNLTSDNDIDIDDNNVINGNVTTTGSLDINGSSVVNGVCTPSEPECTGVPAGGGGSNTLLLSPQGTETLGGITVRDDDIADYDPGSGTATLFFDGSALLTDLAGDDDIDALHYLPSGNIIISTLNDGEVGGLSFGDDDLAEYDPVADTATLFFDGGNLFSNTSEDIDGVYVLSNGNILLSTLGGATLGGLTFEDGDIVEYNPGTDTATLYFDEDLFSGDENIDGLHVLSNGNLLITTTGGATLGGLTFEDGDVVEYDPVADTATLYFDEDDFSDGADVDAVSRIEAATGNTPEADFRFDALPGDWDGTAGEVIDSSGNGNDGTTDAASSTTTVDPGQICNAALFDGVDDYVTWSGLGSVLTGTASLSFWIKTTQTGNNTAWQAPGVAGIEESGGADDIFWGWIDASGRIGISVGNNNATKSVTAINNGNFRHVVLTRDASSGDYKIYIDGVLDASGTGTAGTIGNSFTSIGRIENTGPGALNYLDAELDELLVFSAVLSDAEVSDIYNNQNAGLNYDGSTRTCLTPPPVICTANYRDEFGSASFANNDGDANFSAGWDVFEGSSLTVPESSPSTSSGKVQISGGRLSITNTSPESANAPGIERELDLTGFTSATFSFDYETDNGVDTDDSIVIEASSDGGSNWTVLEDIDGINDETGSRSYDLTPYISSQTRIRLRVDTNINSGACCYGGGTETIFIDNINIDATGACPAVDNFLINVGSGNANACSPYPFTVTARDSSNNTVTDYTGTVAITTSTANGSFAAGSPAPTNNLNPNPDNDDNGSVGYSFDVADNGEINLTIENPRIESLTITVNDSSASVASTSATINFAEVGFEVVDSDTDIAGDNIVVAGRDHDFRITATRLDPVNGCGTATGYDGLKDLKLWRTQNAADPSSVDPTLAGGNLPNTEGAGTTQVSFTSGVANVILDTADIGKYIINVADRTGTFTAADIIGNSAEVTVRPFGLAVTGIVAGATTNPGADTAGGAVFTSAANPFSATVTGVLWNSANDADNDGVLDAGSYNDNVANPAPGYAWNSPWTITAFTPASGTVGTLSNAIFPQAGFAGGAQTITTVEYDEVGSFTFQSNATGFLGTSGVDIDSDVITVGRFIPAAFDVTVVSNGSFDASCGIFTYLGQDFSYDSNPQLTVTAVNADGNPTGNYRDAFAKLGSAGVNIDVANDSSNGLAVSFSGATKAVVARNNNTGIVDVTLGNDVLRYGPDAPLGLFSKEDASEIPLFNSDIRPTISSINDGEVSTAIGQDIVPTPVEMRFGRLSMTNVNGSELDNLDMPVTTEYLDAGGFFVRNLADTCTSITVADLVLANNLNGGSSTASVLNDPASAGDIDYRFSAPGSGNDGFIDVTTVLTNLPWLRYDWDDDGEHDEDPSARATFGIFRGNDVQIYIQQVYP